MLDWADERYRADLKDGQDFERFSLAVLRRIGMDLRPAVGLKAQVRHGDTVAGLEIKNDRQYHDTGNLFIETAECPLPGQPLQPAGIYHPSEPWLYLIGDVENILIFGVKVLRRMHRSGKFQELLIGNRTARGFLVPFATAKDLAEKALEPRRLLCIHDLPPELCKVCNGTVKRMIGVA